MILVDPLLFKPCSYTVQLVASSGQRGDPDIPNLELISACLSLFPSIIVVCCGVEMLSWSKSLVLFSLDVLEKEVFWAIMQVQFDFEVGIERLLRQKNAKK